MISCIRIKQLESLLNDYVKWTHGEDISLPLSSAVDSRDKLEKRLKILLGDNAKVPTAYDC